jgi:prepilin-type N-terminal cleavage/methylation domain-containing protein
MRLHSRREGFTLLELMIVVAIAGILASIAIPSFLMYQARSKRSEAYTNLEGIRKVQLIYFSEFGAFVMASPAPLMSLTPDKQNWLNSGDNRFSIDPPGTGFELLGWVPEGATYFDYDTHASAGSDGPLFTAAAYGDVDGDGLLSVFMYVFPDQAGNTLPCWQCPGGIVPTVTWGNPPVDAFGNDVLNSVAPLIPPAGDDF